MAETTSTSPESKEPRAGVRATSVGLITFTFCVAIACVIALSSVLTQARMSSISIDGVPLSIWKLDDIRLQWAEIRDVIAILSKSITRAERARADHTKVAADAEQKFRSKQHTLIVKLGELIFRLRTIDPELAKTVEKTGDPAERYAIIGVAQSRLLTDHAELKLFFDELDTVYKDYGKARDENTAADLTGSSIVAQIKKLQDSASGSRTSLQTLYRQINPKFAQNTGDPKSGAGNTEIDDATRSRIENALYELHSGPWILSTFVNVLVTTQSDILTLTLVILMGVLGSSLQMTHAFFKEHRTEKIGAYLLRICVGAITALVIFIVAKAGVPVIADATRLGGDAAINPYFVSFLAIISGLMSENAILSVQNQAARFFGPDTPVEPARWARQNLRETFKTSGRDPDRVKSLVKAKDNEFEEWISGKEAMPANVQMIVAGVLQIPPRDLFTDIPPNQAGSTA